jgi:trimethylamine--corrinoid protein Co-methyltransferase
MAHYLGLPVFSTAGCTDSVEFDGQAAVESALSCLMAALSGANLIHDVGFAESSNSASLELIAATDEFIGFIDTIVKGVEINEDALALDAIDRMGPGGMFLTDDHTVRNFRKNWFPLMMNRQKFDGWSAEGGLSLEEKANRRVRDILEKHRPEPLSNEVAAELEKMEKSWMKEAS